MKKEIIKSIRQSIESIRSLEEQVDVLQKTAELAVSTIKSGGTIFITGNGGSAADAQHMAAELIGKLGMGIERKPLPAIALSTDTSIITAISNDFGFDRIFSKQIEALADKKDLLLAISTSGESRNIVEAVKVAKRKGMRVVLLMGSKDSILENMADIVIKIKGNNTPRIQEGHQATIHILCQLIESQFVK